MEDKNLLYLYLSLTITTRFTSHTINATQLNKCSTAIYRGVATFLHVPPKVGTLLVESRKGLYESRCPLTKAEKRVRFK